jgi:hypothetical protein
MNCACPYSIDMNFVTKFADIRKNSKEIILILFIALATTIIASPKYTSQFLRKPPDHIFIGMTAYFEDFYYYLDQFRQGADGYWMTYNKFSNENFPPTFIYMTNLLLGKLGGVFGWESFVSFNIFGILLKYIYILFSYIPIALVFPKHFKFRISAFLVYLFSTSLPQINLIGGKIDLIGPIDAFRTENRILARFGTSPSGSVVNILFLILLILMIRILMNIKIYTEKQNGKINYIDFFSKYFRSLGLAIFLIFYLTISDAAKASILFGVIPLLVIFNMPTIRKTDFITLVIVVFACLIAPFIIGSLYTLLVVGSDPVYKQAVAWDMTEYFRQPKAMGIKGFVMAFAPILTFIIIGIPRFIRKKSKNIYEQTAGWISLICAVLYAIPMILKIPIPGFRFIFPATYIFFAIISIYGFITLFHKLSRFLSFAAIIMVYLSVNFITLFQGWYVSIQPLKEPEYHFAYMPDKLFEGLVKLRDMEPKNGVVLASAYSSTDLMIPGISGKTTYSGHFLTTYKSDEKDKNSRAFFFEWTDTSQTHKFLKDNNIRFIVCTQYDALLDKLKYYYPFLKVAYENDLITIFRYDG